MVWLGKSRNEKQKNTRVLAAALPARLRAFRGFLKVGAIGV
jgi:hypothetical protein